MEVLYGLHPVEEAVRSGSRRLDQVLLRYEWHSRHHLGHARAVPR